MAASTTSEVAIEAIHCRARGLSVASEVAIEAIHCRARALSVASEVAIEAIHRRARALSVASELAIEATHCCARGLSVGASSGTVGVAIVAGLSPAACTSLSFAGSGTVAGLSLAGACVA